MRGRAEEKQQHSEEKRRKAEDDEGHGEEEEGFGEYDEGYGEEDGGFELSNMIRNSRDSKRYRLYGKKICVSFVLYIFYDLSFIDTVIRKAFFSILSL